MEKTLLESQPSLIGEPKTLGARLERWFTSVTEREELNLISQNTINKPGFFLTFTVLFAALSNAPLDKKMLLYLHWRPTIRFQQFSLMISVSNSIRKFDIHHCSQ